MLRSFEDLVAWQAARRLTGDVYKATRKEAFARDFYLKDQIRAACVSIMSNLAEGFDRKHRKEFLQYVNMARGSCAEAKSQLYVAIDAGYITQTEFDNLMNQANEIGRILGGLRKSLERPAKLDA